LLGIRRGELAQCEPGSEFPPNPAAAGGVAPGVGRKHHPIVSLSVLANQAISHKMHKSKLTFFQSQYPVPHESYFFTSDRSLPCETSELLGSALASDSGNGCGGDFGHRKPDERSSHFD
jgi:hypothetical protein